jgi:hypothetical protein
MKNIFRLFQVLLLLVLLESSIGMGNYGYYKDGDAIIVIDNFDDSGNAVFEKRGYDILLDKDINQNSRSDVEFKLKKDKQEIPLFVLKLKNVENTGPFNTANFTFEIENKLNNKNIQLTSLMQEYELVNSSSIVVKEDIDTILLLFFSSGTKNFDNAIKLILSLILSVDEGIRYDAEIEKLDVTISEALIDALTSLSSPTLPVKSKQSDQSDNASLDFVLATLDKKLVSNIFETK